MIFSSHLSQIPVILFRFHRLFHISSFAIHHTFRSYVLLVSQELHSHEDVILCRVVSFLAHLTQRLLSSFCVRRRRRRRPRLQTFHTFFFFETTEQIWTKLGRNVHWEVLYQICYFGLDRKTNMATRANNVF